MTDEFLSKFKKENVIALVSLLLIYIVIFGFPNTNNNLIVTILSIGSYLIFQELSKNKSLRDFIFKKIILKTEKNFRIGNLEHDYYDLSEDYRKEIDKIDKYVDKFVSDYILGIFILIFLFVLIITNNLGFLYFNNFYLQNFFIPGWSIIVGIIIMNLITIKNSSEEITHYIKNYIEVFKNKNIGVKR